MEAPGSWNPLLHLVGRNVKTGRNVRDYLTPSFYNGKKEAQRGKVTFIRVHITQGTKPGLKVRPPDPSFSGHSSHEMLKAEAMGVAESPSYD